MSYQCPLCHALLQQKAHHFQCPNRHQFDIAKEGYVNLMPVQHKRSKEPGDNKEMMQARRRFLENEYYNPMRDRVGQLCSEFIPATSSSVQFLDIGCGEGFYTTHVAQRLSSPDSQAQMFGLDISKTAIRYAAKRYHNCQFSVASSHRLPFADQYLDGILRIYAPCKPEELQRCLKPGGVFITVTPAARHLDQLKALIYQQVRPHPDQPESIDGFQLEHSENLHYAMEMSGMHAHDLLQMTPFAWRASAVVKSELMAQSNFTCEADFTLRVYRKVDASASI
ncbi:23S rRNA (guanine(745)-N(1))-methyltransferase [Vibrio sp. PP-XX7]